MINLRHAQTGMRLCCLPHGFARVFRLYNTRPGGIRVSPWQSGTIFSKSYFGLTAREISNLYLFSRSALGRSQLCCAQNLSPVK